MIAIKEGLNALNGDDLLWYECERQQQQSKENSSFYEGPDEKREQFVLKVPSHWDTSNNDQPTEGTQFKQSILKIAMTWKTWS